MPPLLPLLLLLILQGSLGPERTDAVVRAMDPFFASRIVDPAVSVQSRAPSALEIVAWLNSTESTTNESPLESPAILPDRRTERVPDGHANHARSRDGPSAHGA